MSKKRALITGLYGQDGSYLAERLLGLGYDVWGLVRSKDSPESVPGDVIARTHRYVGDLRNRESIRAAVETARPDEVYNLAAQSDAQVSLKDPEGTLDVNYRGFERLVEEVVRVNRHAHIFQASSSEMFGASVPPQNERSPLAPTNPYGEAKVLAHGKVVKPYRERGTFVSTGILFNHESPRRPARAVTRKITSSLARIKRGMQEKFALGNLEMKRDWGFAGDYVRAMHLMLTHKVPDDFVVATGETHTVREFVEESARALDMHLEWEGEGLGEVARDEKGKVILEVSKEWYRPNDINTYRGDSSKARSVLGWKPEVSFGELVEMMARADLAALALQKP